MGKFLFSFLLPQKLNRRTNVVLAYNVPANLCREKQQYEPMKKCFYLPLNSRVTESLALAGMLWIDLQPLINGNTLVWYYEDDIIKTMTI